ncbi:MAG: hypothetical protein RL398_3392 [Planctomycetota bacterium]
MTTDPGEPEFVRERLREEGVDESYERFVLQHVDAPDRGWRWCCGSNCDPCVQRLGRVVDALRIRRGYALGGMPEPPADG